MFFVFYTVLTFFVFQTNSFIIKRENNDVNSEVHETTQSNKTNTPNYSYYLNIFENPKKASNLKSNIFDKMLSNEMFSIKQNLYEKDVLSSVYRSFKNNVATPTLEINQRWPIEKAMTEANVNSKFENVTSDIAVDKLLFNKSFVTPENKTNNYKENDFNIKVGTKNKVIEVRSFSVMPVIHNSESLLHNPHAKRQCTCMRNNPLTICSHRGSGAAQTNTEKICTHTENNFMTGPECTRTAETYPVSLTYFPYYVYPTYFLGITTDAFNTYYHPDIVNDLKLPKIKKHKKIKKPHIDEELFSESGESEEVDDDENQYDYLENYKSGSKTYTCLKNKCKKTSKIYTVNYDDSHIYVSHLPKNNNNGYVKVIDRENFVDDIIQDLKIHYNDAVIKDCYCSVSSFICRSKSMLIYVAIFLHLL